MKSIKQNWIMMDASKGALRHSLGYPHTSSPPMFNPRRQDRILTEFEDLDVNEKIQKLYK